MGQMDYSVSNFNVLYLGQLSSKVHNFCMHLSCPLYQNTRLQLNDTIKSAIVSWDTELLKEIFNSGNVVTLSKYVLQLLDTRFPKDKDLANTKASKKKRKQKTRRDSAENIHHPLATQPAMPIRVQHRGGGGGGIIPHFYRYFWILKFWGGYSGFADFSSFNDFENLGVYSGFNENVLKQLKTRIRIHKINK